jgi:dephospho-CoA kinase
MKKVLLVSGKMQSGKNTFADIFERLATEKSLTTKQISFAKPVKDRTREDFSNLVNFLNSKVSYIRKLAIDLKKASLNNTADDIIKELEKLTITKENFYEDKTELSRILLTTYGTDIFRNRVSKNYWVEQTKKDIEKELSTKTLEDFTIITDWRFPNELWVLDTSEEFKSISIRINRETKRDASVSSHDSEIALDSFTKFDYVIENDSTKDVFEEKISKIFQEILDEG